MVVMNVTFDFIMAIEARLFDLYHGGPWGMEAADRGAATGASPALVGPGQRGRRD